MEVNILNKLQVFKHVEFGSVRVVVRDEKPWFVAKDVAEALGYKDTVSAILDHCKHAETLKGGKTPPFDNRAETLKVGKTPPFDVCPELQAMHPQTKIINQADVLRLVVHSKLPAAEKVELWLFDEVGASVLEHGAYMTPQTAVALLKDPRKLGELLIQFADTQDKLAVAEEKIAIDAHKVAFTEKVMTGKELIGIGTLSKILANHSPIDFGAIKLHEWMRDNGYTMYGKLGIEPTERSKTNGWMKISGDDTPVGFKSCALVTWKGVMHFVKVFQNLEANGMKKLRNRKAPKVVIRQGEVGVKCEEQKELQ
jgi:prophage antirepressor-like protein